MSTAAEVLAALLASRPDLAEDYARATAEVTKANAKGKAFRRIEKYFPAIADMTPESKKKTDAQEKTYATLLKFADFVSDNVRVIAANPDSAVKDFHNDRHVFTVPTEAGTLKVTLVRDAGQDDDNE